MGTCRRSSAQTEGRRFLCEPCKDEARRESDREYLDRVRPERNARRLARYRREMERGPDRRTLAPRSSTT